jgi:hypothetical protein
LHYWISIAAQSADRLIISEEENKVGARLILAKPNQWNPKEEKNEGQRTSRSFHDQRMIA